MHVDAPKPLLRGRGRLGRPGLVGAVLAVGLWGCGEECVTVDPGCAPLYAPTFENVFARTLAPTCAVGDSSCHGASGGRGGLVLAEREAAYAALVGVGARDGGVRVVPGDPGCSALVVRLVSDDAEVQMPPGAPLAEAERCAIEQWIANGAPP